MENVTKGFVIARTKNRNGIQDFLSQYSTERTRGFAIEPVYTSSLNSAKIFSFRDKEKAIGECKICEQLAKNDLAGNPQGLLIYEVYEVGLLSRVLGPNQ